MVKRALKFVEGLRAKQGADQFLHQDRQVCVVKRRKKFRDISQAIRYSHEVIV